MATAGKVILILIAIPVGIFFVVFLYFLINPDNEPMSDKIARECQREYGARGEIAVGNCRITMTTRYLAEKEREKAKAVYDRVR